MITAATLGKQHLFRGRERLTILHDLLLEIADEQSWDLLAWAVFDNHYHILGNSPDADKAPAKLCGKLHGLSAIKLNEHDGTRDRPVWYRSWDTRITYEKSLMARMAYVYTNPVKHGIVRLAKDYPWCSAAWFEREGDPPFVKSVLSFKTDRVNVYDEFEPLTEL
jgi:putative transposase